MAPHILRRIVHFPFFCRCSITSSSERIGTREVSGEITTIVEGIDDLFGDLVVFSIINIILRERPRPDDTKLAFLLQPLWGSLAAASREAATTSAILSHGGK